MKTRILFLAILASIFMVSCNDDDDIKVYNDGLNLTLPITLNGARIQNIIVKIKNINTGEEIIKEMNSNHLDLNLEAGVYNFEVMGTSVVRGIKIPVRGVKNNVEVAGGEEIFFNEIPLFEVKSSKGLVISEIFFSGTKTPKGKKYRQDKFIEIYNNSDETLYADGLCIAETSFLTALNVNELTPNIISKETPVGVVYRIPGSGKEHPVKPGKTIVLCDIGINHKEQNEYSFDLSNADFEWYDNHKLDTDVAEVPNLEKIVSYSKSVWTPHERGFKSYLIFRPETPFTAEQFALNNAYHYKYHFVFGDKVDKWIERDTWKIPNDWIIDAVQCSTPSKYEWSVMSPELDFSWTHSGDGDDARYGHSIKRKIAKRDGDRIVLQDTNDSASDFIATAPNPSPGKVVDHAHK